jgi:RNase P/RNase MRP subunit POP5
VKRQKRRYLGLRLDVDCAPNEKDFLDAVWVSLSRLFGEVGASLAGLVLIRYDVEGKRAVLRVNLIAVDSVRAALAALTTLGGKAAAVHVVAVSGTIKALLEGLNP